MHLSPGRLERRRGQPDAVRSPECRPPANPSGIYSYSYSYSCIWCCWYSWYVVRAIPCNVLCTIAVRVQALDPSTMRNVSRCIPAEPKVKLQDYTGASVPYEDDA